MVWVLCQVKTKNAKICLNFNLPSQNSKCQDLPKFKFSGGGGGWYSEQISEQGVLPNLNQKFWKPSLPLITGSLSYTTYVETNEQLELTTPI